MIALLRSILALSFVLSGAILACAETFPSRQVHLIVSYSAGGAADIIARSVAQRLSEMWSQTVVIENRAGGATQIAASVVAQSPPDGYKLLVTGMETFAISPFLYSKLSYDPDKDFVPVSGFGYANQILTVPASSQLKSIGDLLAEARKGKSLLQYGTVGMGGSSHINMVLLESLAGVKLEPIHYRGGAPMLNDLVGAHVPMGFLSVTLVDQYIKVGTLRALGIGSKKRLPQLPDVPTIDESGVPGFEAVSWFGLFAPRGTPDDVVKKINADVQKVFADPDFQQKFLLPNFLNVIPGNPTEFEGYIKAEAAKWSQVIKGAHLHME